MIMSFTHLACLPFPHLTVVLLLMQGASDVVVCLLDREGVVNLRDGWNLPGAYINVADKEQGLGLELLNGSIVDTTLTCR